MLFLLKFRKKIISFFFIHKSIIFLWDDNRKLYQKLWEWFSIFFFFCIFLACIYDKDRQTFQGTHPRKCLALLSVCLISRVVSGPISRQRDQTNMCKFARFTIVAHLKPRAWFFFPLLLLLLLLLPHIRISLFALAHVQNNECPVKNEAPLWRLNYSGRALPHHIYLYSHIHILNILTLMRA